MPEMCAICEKQHDDIAIRDVELKTEPRAICGPCYNDYRDKHDGKTPIVRKVLGKERSNESESDENGKLVKQILEERVKLDKEFKKLGEGFDKLHAERKEFEDEKAKSKEKKD